MTELPPRLVFSSVETMLLLVCVTTRVVVTHASSSMTMAAQRAEPRFSRTSATVLSVVCIALFSILRNLHLLNDLGFLDDYETAHLPVVQQQLPTIKKDDAFSACLLTMDDNHFLVEWLAYHHHTLPLKRLIVAVDPKSKTLPTPIFNKWRKQGMLIDEWTDADFMLKMPKEFLRNVNMTDETRLHHFRQRVFYNECMKRLQLENRTWTMFLDSDEYLVLNQRRKFSMAVPSMKKPASVSSFIQQAMPKNETCIMIPRLRFGAVESTPEQVSKVVPPGFNASNFQTLRFRKHAAVNDFITNKIGKGILDISQIRGKEIHVRDPHRLVWEYCAEEGLRRRNEESFFVIHHYLGTWEQYNFRDDVRKGGNRSRKSYDQVKNVSVGEDDSIRSWIVGFVESKGQNVATDLLEGVGDVQRWLRVQNKTADAGAVAIQGSLSLNQQHDKAAPQDLSSSAQLKKTTVVNTNGTLAEKDVFSACLLVMDDNHVLIEWLAYHYHVLPLRHLIVAVDPRSITSPSEVLDRWRQHGMTIEEWTDKDFMSSKLFSVAQHLAELNQTQVIELHRARQREFYAKCMKRLKSQNRTWTMLTDTDEFLLINRRATKRFNVTDAPPMEQPASVMTFLKQERAKNVTEMPKRTVCIMIPRLRFGSRESSTKHINAQVPAGFNASTFTTLRHRKHAQPKVSNINKTGKVIVDVSRLNPQRIIVKNPHRPLWAYCPRSELFTEIMDNLFVIHHYAGTWEQYTFRDDFRAMKTKQAFDQYNNRNLDDDAIRPWLDGFVQDKGVETASALLKDVGVVPLKNASATA